MEYILYKQLAGTIQARKSCLASGNTEWFDKHTETINKLVDKLPSGSGFDNGTKIDLDASHADKLVFYTSYHHSNESGMYDGWTDHTVTVTPSLVNGFNLRISGRNRNDIKEMMYEEFDYALREDVTYDLFLPHFPQYAITSKWEDKDGSPSQCYQAWYVRNPEFAQESPFAYKKFWNDFNGAKKHAASLMLAERNAPKV